MKTTTEAIYIHVHHHDMEQHARSFNEGYETAMAQHLAPDMGTATDWLEEQKARARHAALARLLAMAEAYATGGPDDAVISPDEIRSAMSRELR